MFNWWKEVKKMENLKLILVFFIVMLYGCSTMPMPQVIINDYGVNIQPDVNKGMAVSKHWENKPMVYGPGTFDDPTVVVFRNRSYYVTYYVSIDDNKPIKVLPDTATLNQYLPFGRHKVVVWGEIETARFGKKRTPDRVISIHIHPSGRAKVINLYNSNYYYNDYYFRH
jgi:hypothetical protein